MVVIVLLFLKQRRGQVVLNLPAHVAPCNLLNRRSTFLPVNGYWQATSVKHYHSGHWPHPDSTRTHGHPGSAWGGATWQNTRLRVWQNKKKNAEMKNKNKKMAWRETIHMRASLLIHSKQVREDQQMSLGIRNLLWINSQLLCWEFHFVL